MLDATAKQCEYQCMDAASLTPAQTAIIDECGDALAMDFDTPAKITEGRAALALGISIKTLRRVSWDLGTLRGE